MSVGCWKIKWRHDLFLNTNFLKVPSKVCNASNARTSLDFLKSRGIDTVAMTMLINSVRNVKTWDLVTVDQLLEKVQTLPFIKCWRICQCIARITSKIVAKFLLMLKTSLIISRHSAKYDDKSYSQTCFGSLVCRLLKAKIKAEIKGFLLRYRLFLYQ